MTWRIPSGVAVVADEGDVAWTITLADPIPRGLPPVAYDVWLHADGAGTVEEVAERLGPQYGAVPLDEVATFVDALVDVGRLEVAP